MKDTRKDPMKDNHIKDNTRKDTKEDNTNKDTRNNNKKDLYYPMTFNKY